MLLSNSYTNTSKFFSFANAAIYYQLYIKITQQEPSGIFVLLSQPFELLMYAFSVFNAFFVYYLIFAWAHSDAPPPNEIGRHALLEGNSPRHDEPHGPMVHYQHKAYALSPKRRLHKGLRLSQQRHKPLFIPSRCKP